MMDIKRVVTRLAASMALLAMGGTIYVLFRTTPMNIHLLLQEMNLAHQASQWQGAVSHIVLPSWMIYNLPGGLWSASAIIWMDALMSNTSPRKCLCWCSIIPITGITSEIMQNMGMLPGTYDPIDLMFYIIPLAIYIIAKNNLIIHTS